MILPYREKRLHWDSKIIRSSRIFSSADIAGWARKLLAANSEELN